jgi:exopolysaccharide production protein ExoZ
MDAKRSPQFLGIQYLRGIAALLVAYLHLSIQIPSYTSWLSRYLGADLNLGVGVDIFFVISGFIMVVSTGASTPREFFIKRVVRVVPLYWVMTLMVVMGYLLHPEWFRTTVVSFEYVLKSLFFVPYQNPGHGGDLMPVLVPGWSLNFEMAFYAVFALSLLLPENRRLLAVGGVFLALFALGQLPAAQSLPSAVRFYIDPRIGEFWLGMLIGSQINVAVNRRISSRILLLLTILASVLLLMPASTYAAMPLMWVVLIGNILPAGLLVWCLACLELQGRVPRLSALKRLGDASYSIYLSHILTLGVVRVLWVKLGLGADDLLHAAGFALVSMVSVVLVGWAVYVLVEQPLLGRLRRRAQA